MDDSAVDSTILKFLKQEALQGRLESTTREISDRTGISYTTVGKALERLKERKKVSYRERGRQNSPTRYYYLEDIIKMCRDKWQS